MVDATVYAEAFVEVDGWRWRVCESDPGLIELHYQEWDEKLRTWKTHDSGQVKAREPSGTSPRSY